MAVNNDARTFGRMLRREIQRAAGAGNMGAWCDARGWSASTRAAWFAGRRIPDRLTLDRILIACGTEPLDVENIEFAALLADRERAGLGSTRSGGVTPGDEGSP
jgi:hypothetical protein